MIDRYHARPIARDWANRHLSSRNGFAGALLHGSAAWLTADAKLGPASDIDLLAVFDREAPPGIAGKHEVDGRVLDVTPLRWAQIASTERILAHYHLAGSFRGQEPVLDPRGLLAALSRQVGARFADPIWIAARCDHAVRNAEDHFGGVNADQLLHDAVTGWLFGTGVMTHVLLTAGLRNPTVRRRYESVHELLHERDMGDVHERLLALLGSAAFERANVEHHFASLPDVFDLAASVARTPQPFTADIAAHARPLAIEGIAASIDAGLHREAVFWMTATYSRCRRIVAVDAPELLPRIDEAFVPLLVDLGVLDRAGLLRRKDTSMLALPWVRSVADRVISGSP